MWINLCSMTKYRLRLEGKLFSATMRCWNRVDIIVVVVFAQRCRYSDSTPAKLVTEKCDKARNLVKLSARLGGRARASRRLKYVYSDPRKIPWISRRERTSWQHVLTESSCCRSRCNFKGVCLSGRVAVTCTCGNVREIFILHSFLKNIITIVPPRPSLHISGF